MTLWQKTSKDPRWLRLGMNVWPPFLAAGIVVEVLNQDFRYVRVALKPTAFNRNYVGTHFGGSLFAMTDPFFMLMLIKNMGDHYYVWDRSARIDFIAPGQGKVIAEMRISEADVQEMRSATEGGQKFERDFSTSIVDGRGELVAKVSKRIYARLKPAFRPVASSDS